MQCSRGEYDVMCVDKGKKHDEYFFCRKYKRQFKDDEDYNARYECNKDGDLYICRGGEYENIDWWCSRAEFDVLLVGFGRDDDPKGKNKCRNLPASKSTIKGNIISLDKRYDPSTLCYNKKVDKYVHFSNNFDIYYDPPNNQFSIIIIDWSVWITHDEINNLITNIRTKLASKSFYDQYKPSKDLFSIYRVRLDFFRKLIHSLEPHGRLFINGFTAPYLDRHYKFNVKDDDLCFISDDGNELTYDIYLEYLSKFSLPYFYDVEIPDSYNGSEKIKGQLMKLQESIEKQIKSFYDFLQRYNIGISKEDSTDQTKKYVNYCVFENQLAPGELRYGWFDFV